MIRFFCFAKYVLFLWIILLGLGSCQQEQGTNTKETRFLLGTIVEFTIFNDNEELALQAIQEATNAMQAVENTFTIYGSVNNSVKAFNRALVGQEVELEPSVSSLLDLSFKVHQQTLGAFDPTLGELNQRWGFSNAQQPTVPLKKSEVFAALQQSGVQKLKQVHPNVWVKSQEGLKLDFGAIAKGLAIDQGVQALKVRGIQHAIINAGGDMRILGDHGNKPWKVAVRHPRVETPLGWFEVKHDLSIVTSGDYERFFIYDGKRFHHIIDPKTGYPSQSSLSVTVSAPTAVQADALSTAMFILGYEKGMDIIETIDNVECVWVDVSLTVHMTSGMKAQFHLMENRGELL